MGDKLVGTITALDERTSDYGTYPIVTVQTDEGETAFHGFHTVAKNEIARQRPEIGDEIAVKYFGISSDDHGYERYRVLVDHKSAPATTPDWDKLGADAERELRGDWGQDAADS